MVQAAYPELVHSDRAEQQSGEDFHRLDSLQNAYTGIWWYASYPNHYAGDGSFGSVEMGKLIMDNEVDQLAKMIKTVKADKKTLELQKQFYEDAKHPTKTEQ